MRDVLNNLRQNNNNNPHPQRIPVKKKNANSEDGPHCNLSTQFVESKVNLLNKCDHALLKKTQDRFVNISKFLEFQSL